MIQVWNCKYHLVFGSVPQKGNTRENLEIGRDKGTMDHPFDLHFTKQGETGLISVTNRIKEEDGTHRNDPVVPPSL